MHTKKCIEKQKAHRTKNTLTTTYHWFSVVFACVHNFFVWQPGQKICACFIALWKIRKTTHFLQYL